MKPFRDTVIVCLALCLLAQPARALPGNQAASDPDTRPIVLVGGLDYQSDHSAALYLLRVAFAVGDGTLLLTAAHCVDQFLDPPRGVATRLLFVISPYYGDLLPVQVLAIDKTVDVAVLKVRWPGPGHPAYALADPNTLAPGQAVAVPSRPQFKGEVHRIQKEVFVEHLTVERLNAVKPQEGILFTSGGQIERGWSGSPLLFQETGQVAGILCLLKSTTVVRFLLFKHTQVRAAGCSTRDVVPFLRAHRLAEAVLARPGTYPRIEDGQTVFAQILDFYDAFAGKDPNALRDTTRVLTQSRPHSAYVQLMSGLGLAWASGSHPDTDALRARVESRFRTALSRGPNQPEVLSIYGDILKTRKKYNEAISYTEAALQQDPNNRLALLNQLRNLFLDVADISQLQPGN